MNAFLTCNKFTRLLSPSILKRMILPHQVRIPQPSAKSWVLTKYGQEQSTKSKKKTFENLVKLPSSALIWSTVNTIFVINLLPFELISLLSAPTSFDGPPYRWPYHLRLRIRILSSVKQQGFYLSSLDTNNTLSKSSIHMYVVPV